MSLLRKCPFCGGNAKVEYGRIVATVVCQKCHIGIFRSEHGRWDTWELKNADEAIEAWNHRYEPSEQERWLNGE